MSLLQIWEWWKGDGPPAAAIQQAFFIVLTTIATIVACLNLSTWKRQQRGAAKASASKELLDAASLVSEHMLIERLSPTPMVFFTDLHGFNLNWQKAAIEKIEGELHYWKEHKDQLNKRTQALTGQLTKSALTLGGLAALSQKVDALLSLVKRYHEAVETREQFVSSVLELNTEDAYRRMLSLTSISKSHPILWRKERNLASIEFESDVRRAIDSLKAVLTD